MWEYRAKLVRVIDGDTVVLLCDTGFNGRQEEHFRLFAVNAPEISQPGGVETKQFLEKWFTRVSHRQWPLRIKTVPNLLVEPEEKRTFTRYLVTIFDIIQPQIESLNKTISDYILLEHPEWESDM